ncbi:hypothetical protein VUR80DRAFT_2758 [Thermomyces stellatus]
MQGCRDAAWELRRGCPRPQFRCVAASTLCRGANSPAQPRVQLGSWGKSIGAATLSSVLRGGRELRVSTCRACCLPRGRSPVALSPGILARKACLRPACRFPNREKHGQNQQAACALCARQGVPFQIEVLGGHDALARWHGSPVEVSFPEAVFWWGAPPIPVGLAGGRRH